MRLKPALVLLFLCVITGGLLAQSRKSFTHEPEAFVKELSDMLNASRKKVGKQFVEDEFGTVFLGLEYSDAMRTTAYAMGDAMLKAKMRAYPEFEAYLRFLIAFPTSGRSESDFSNWHVVATSLLENRKQKKYFDDFVLNSALLYGEGVFYKSASVTWRSTNRDFEITVDSLPKVIFKGGDLICEAKGDSSVVRGTTGTFFPTLERWYGTGGRVTWERADFDPEKTYAEFQDYEIRIKGSTYSIDSVLFYNEFFAEPLKGQLKEKILAGKQGERASYPRFESYNKRLQIRNMFPGVHYDGGFTMAGNRLAGTGSIEEPALLSIDREGQPFFSANSLEFSIRATRISSDHSTGLFILEEDTIAHPDLNLKFDQGTRELTLLRSDEGLSKSPYTNTYHNIDMYFEALYWRIDDPLMELGNLRGSSQTYAAFESNDFYKDLRYDALMGIGQTHPLIEVRNHARSAGSDVFPLENLAFDLRTGAENLHPLMIDLANKGFVEYDLNTRMVTVTQKLHDTLARNAGRMDYDVIQFSSDARTGVNAQLNLLNNSLFLRGVQKIQLSDSQDVRIYPAKEEVILKKNRDFKFSGRIWAGNFEFLGKEFHFDYDAFLIDLVNVDSCRIYVEDTEDIEDSYGNKRKLRVKNVLEDVAGTLKIDGPTNKSGLSPEKYSQYPIFESTKNSYVYYDNVNIQNGVYERDNFYYQIQPFTIDSLDNFSKADLAFNGTLVSGGIFPDIERPLTLMEDLALGFDMATSDGGLPMYGGKADFTANVTLDYDGLHGEGKLNYLTSEATSEYFRFFPDSTTGQTNSYLNTMKKGPPEIPKTAAEVVDLGFYPNADLLTATSGAEDIRFFENEATLAGRLYLQPSGMTGRGTMYFSGAELDSKKFDYTMRKIFADTSDFRLNQSANEDNLAFKTTDVNAEIDFDERTGMFKSNGGETKVEFPINQYICFMDEFKWFMDANDMELSSSRKVTDDFVIDTSEDQARSNFFSINQFQDSLNFLSPKAVYDIENSVIQCDKIKYIAVADAKIQPDSGKVVIRKRAKMDPLANAEVVANYVTQYHRIFNANLEIEGRLSYFGEGDYTYKDEAEKEFIIHLQQVKVDTSFQTVGNGMIAEDDGFAISPFFEYYGKFNLESNEKNLYFDGGTRILHTCEFMERSWFKFASLIDPQEVFIPVDSTLRSMGAEKLGVGVMVADDTPMELYSAFLSRKKDRQDEGLIESLGFLTYDKKDKAYKVGSKEKIAQPDLPGDLIVLDTESCLITGDGQIDLQADFGLLTADPIGSVTNDGLKTETNIEGTLALNFPLDESLTKHILKEMSESSNLSPVDIGSTQYEKAIRELMGLEKSDKVITKLNIDGTLKKIPEELQSTFFFADVKWQWNDVDEAYQSAGKLGIGSVGKDQVFRYINGKIEVSKSRGKDVFRMYLEIDPSQWYYFEYSAATKIMMISSSDLEFMTLLTEIKDDKRKAKQGKLTFTYQSLISKAKRNKFIERFPEFE